MVEETLDSATERMKKAVENTRTEFNTVRAGRATPALLDRVTVDYYGTQTPLTQMASVAAPDPRTITITPWDKGVLHDIEKAIQRADLGVNPSNDGTMIRLPIPPLTEERRRELIKQVKSLSEEGRVAIRNIRRDANEQLKRLEKDGDFSEDDLKRAQGKVDELTKRFVAEVDHMVEKKEADLLEV